MNTTDLAKHIVSQIKPSEEVQQLRSDLAALRALVVKKDEALRRIANTYMNNGFQGLASEALALTPANLAGYVCVKREEWEVAKDRIDDLIAKNIEGKNQLDASCAYCDQLRSQLDAITEELRVANKKLAFETGSGAEARQAVGVQGQENEDLRARLTAAEEARDKAVVDARIARASRDVNLHDCVLAKQEAERNLSLYIQEQGFHGKTASTPTASRDAAIAREHEARGRAECVISILHYLGWEIPSDTKTGDRILLNENGVSCVPIRLIPGSEAAGDVSELYLLREIATGLDHGVDLIAKERSRQISVEGWTPQHDDQHNEKEMAYAAAAYVLAACGAEGKDWWPWSHADWKDNPDDPKRSLIKSGALIAAELDRLERLTARNSGGAEQ